MKTTPNGGHPMPPARMLAEALGLLGLMAVVYFTILGIAALIGA